MADFYNYGFLNRARRNRIFDQPEDDTSISSPELSRMPEVEAPQEAPQQAPQEGAAYRAYMEKLGQAPKEADYKPSRTRKILGMIAAGGVGAFGGAREGAEVGRNIIHGPYFEAQRKYQEGLAPLATQAKLEAENRKAQLEDVLKRAQAHRYGTQSQADLAKAEKDRFGTSQEGQEFELKKVRPVSQGTGWRSVLKDGQWVAEKFGTDAGEIAKGHDVAAGERNVATNEAALGRTREIIAGENARNAAGITSREGIAARGQAGETGRNEARIKAANDRLDKSIAARSTAAKPPTPAAIKTARQEAVKLIVQTNPEFHEFGDEKGNMLEFDPGWWEKNVSNTGVEDKHKRFMQLLESTVNQMLNTNSIRTTGGLSMGKVGAPKGLVGEPDEDDEEENIFF